MSSRRIYSRRKQIDIRTAVAFDSAEVAAITSAIKAAAEEREAYLTVGNHFTDYGREWPEVAERQAAEYDVLASVAHKLRDEPLEALCRDMARALREAADEYNDGGLGEPVRGLDRYPDVAVSDLADND